MPFSREKYSNTRSRPRQDCAYSPTGPVASVSVAARRRPAATSGYTLPVEKTTMRERGEAPGDVAGTIVLWAQVRSGRSRGAELPPGQVEDVRDARAARRPARGRGGRRRRPRSRRARGRAASPAPRSARRPRRAAARRPRRRPRRTRRAREGPSSRPRPGRARRRSACARRRRRPAEGAGEQLLEVRFVFDRRGQRDVGRIGRGPPRPFVGAARRSLLSLCGRLSPARSLPRCSMAPAPRTPVVPLFASPSMRKLSSWAKPVP